MRKIIICCALALLTPLVAGAEEKKVYRLIDADGNVYFGDSIPVEYAEFPKEVLNDRGVIVGTLDGKKTEEQKEAERLENERRVAQELQQRADQALLATYLTVEEILMHRDRRIELFLAQSRVTELYLKNLETRLGSLRTDASQYQPYSDDPDAPMIPEALAEDLQVTKETIIRHKHNLKKFQTDKQQIIERFDGDISRFKILKGLDSSIADSVIDTAH
jgi:hypothetical protein